MLALSLIWLSGIIVIGAIFFVECKIIPDLPDSNSFKKWWRKNLIGEAPEDL